jgi:hypothetical protein
LKSAGVMSCCCRYLYRRCYLQVSWWRVPYSKDRIRPVRRRRHRRPRRSVFPVNFFIFFKENQFKRKSTRYIDLILTIFLYIQLEIYRYTFFFFKLLYRRCYLQVSWWRVPYSKDRIRPVRRRRHRRPRRSVFPVNLKKKNVYL